MDLLFLIALILFIILAVIVFIQYLNVSYSDSIVFNIRYNNSLYSNCKLSGYNINCLTPQLTIKALYKNYTIINIVKK